VARRLLNLPPSEEGNAWHVRRLDGGGAYFLVHVADRIACIDAGSGALLVSATTVRTPVTVSREAAVVTAGRGDLAAAELVWKPSAATLSMFDPVWLVTRDDVVAFVDQRGKVWSALPSKRPGGGPG
jgi:hypothetical protein